MHTKQFLRVSGATVLLVAILGWIGVLGPTADKSIFGTTWYFDTKENTLLAVLGVVGLITGYVPSVVLQRMLATAFGVIGISLGLYSFFLNNPLLGITLEDPMDTLSYLTIGAWALYAVFGNITLPRKQKTTYLKNNRKSKKNT